VLYQAEPLPDIRRSRRKCYVKTRGISVGFDYSKKTGDSTQQSAVSENQGETKVIWQSPASPSSHDIAGIGGAKSYS
jgi:hypothetical protein